MAVILHCCKVGSTGSFKTTPSVWMVGIQCDKVSITEHQAQVLRIDGLSGEMSGDLTYVYPL